MNGRGWGACGTASELTALLRRCARGISGVYGALTASVSALNTGTANTL